MRDMLGREELITAQDALRLLFTNAPFRMPVEKSVEILESYGRVISRDILAGEDLPSFSRSTVDGFAVLSADTFGATEGLPSYLAVRGEVLMGVRSGLVLKKGECGKISTGGMLPDGADAVVMFEHTQMIDEGMLEVVRPVSPGENVIAAGEDVHKGDPVFRKGHRLRAEDVGALAGLGITNIWVYEKPAVSIISTGDEIIPAERTTDPGQVRDINSYTLAGLILKAGGCPLRKGIFGDRYEIIKDAAESALKDSGMILISGGSSVGAKDMTSKVINDLGSPGVLFHGVALKPGKPTIGGVVGNTPIFGLPGHPAAVSVCFDVLVRPVLEMQCGVQGKTYERRKGVMTARIAKNISSSPGREEHIGVALEERDGEMWASPLLGKSGLITTLTMAEGTIVIPLSKTGLQKGDVVEVRLF